jgi:hypothetical protein
VRRLFILRKLILYISSSDAESESAWRLTLPKKRLAIQGKSAKPPRASTAIPLIR